MASPTGSSFRNYNDYVLTGSEHLQRDIFESPLAQVLSQLHETASQQMDEAEKERKDAERTMTESYHTQRSLEIDLSASSCPLVVSDIKKALNAARQDPNYFVVKFRPLIGGQFFDLPIKKGSSCYDILNSLSTYFEVDISKVCIISSEIPDANRRLTIENCDVVDQAIRSTNKPIKEFFKKMSIPTFSLKD